MAKLPKITPKKRKWLNARKPMIIRGTPLAPKVSVRIRYQRALSQLIRRMTTETRQALTKLVDSKPSREFQEKQAESAAMDESIAVKAKKLMNKLTSKFTLLFDDQSKILAEAMVESSAKSSKASLAVSMKQLSGGLSIKTGVIPEGMEEVTKALIDANVSLIKSIPQQYLDDVSGAVYRSITVGGQGLYDLIPAIRKYEGITLRRAKTIAHDQTRKAFSVINTQRMQKLGIKQFEWNHHGGSHQPRASHIRISGMIFSYENLIAEQEAVGVPKADQGLPSIPINCACRAIPVLNWDFEE